MAKQSVLMGAAGTLWFTIEEGRPSAIAITLRTSGNATLPTDVTATSILANLGAVNTTCTGTAGTSTLTVVSASGISTEKEYLVGSLTGRERVRVKAISGTTITLYHTLRKTRSGATFCDTTVYNTIIAGNNDVVELNRRARLAYTVGSSTFVRDYLYDVRMHIYVREYDTDDLRNAEPDIDQWIWEEQSGFTGYEPQIDKAEDTLRRDLAKRGRDLDDLMDASQVNDALEARTLYQIYKAWAKADEKFIQGRDHELERYLACVEGLVNSQSIWWDEDHDLATNAALIPTGPRYSWRT